MPFTHRIKRLNTRVPPPPLRHMSYDAASNWISVQAPGVQLYYSIEALPHY
jgi:hypothetical protein